MVANLSIYNSGGIYRKWAVDNVWNNKNNIWYALAYTVHSIQIPSAHCSRKAISFLKPSLSSSKFLVRTLHHEQQNYLPGKSDCFIYLSLIYRDSEGLFSLPPTLPCRFKKVAYLYGRVKGYSTVNILPPLVFTACSPLTLAMPSSSLSCFSSSPLPLSPLRTFPVPEQFLSSLFGTCSLW